MIKCPVKSQILLCIFIAVLSFQIPASTSFNFTQKSNSSKGWLDFIFAGPVIPSLVAGIQVPHSKVPWLVRIFLRDQFICGGALINQEWILTAAHCFKGFKLKYYKVKFVRETNVTVANRSFTSLIQHPSYGETEGHDNDIALVKLDQKVIYDAQIKAAKLQTDPTVLNSSSFCCVAGWGETLGLGQANTLNWACIAIYDRQKCNSSYTGLITDSMICAGYKEGGVDTCQGDSGGPLLCLYESIWIVEGVVSTGESCAQKPGIYTRVASYSEWITSTMAKQETF